MSKAGARRLPAWVALVQGRRQYAIDGSHAPTGSLYRPIVISVDCWTSFSPLARHQRRRSAFRDGTRIPRPMNVCADASSAITPPPPLGTDLHLAHHGQIANLPTTSHFLMPPVGLEPTTVGLTDADMQGFCCGYEQLRLVRAV